MDVILRSRESGVSKDANSSRLSKTLVRNGT
jgi:hypothetical protein